MKTDPIARTYQARLLDSGTGSSKGTETVVRIVAEPAAVAGFQTLHGAVFLRAGRGGRSWDHAIMLHNPRPKAGLGPAQHATK